MNNKDLYNKILKNTKFTSMSQPLDGPGYLAFLYRMRQQRTAAYEPTQNIDIIIKKLEKRGVGELWRKEDPTMASYPTGLIPDDFKPPKPTLPQISGICGVGPPHQPIDDISFPVPTGTKKDFEEDFPNFPLPQPPHVPPTPKLPDPTTPSLPNPPPKKGPPPPEPFVPPPTVPPDPPPTGATNTDAVSLDTDFYQIIDGGIPGKGIRIKMWNGWIKASTYAYDSPGFQTKSPPAFVRDLETGRCVSKLGALNDIDPEKKILTTPTSKANKYFSQNPNSYKTNRGNRFYYEGSPLADNDFFDGYTCTGAGTPNSILQVNWMPFSAFSPAEIWTVNVHRTLFSRGHRMIAHKELLTSASRSELTWGPEQPTIRITGNLIVRIERAINNQKIVIAKSFAPPNEFNITVTTDSDQVKYGHKYYNKSFGITYTSTRPLDGGEWQGYKILEFPYVFSAMVTPIAIENLTIKVTPAFNA